MKITPIQPTAPNEILLYHNISTLTERLIIDKIKAIKNLLTIIISKI